MSKMNVKSGKRKKKSSIAVSDEERKKRYYYNQLRKRREVINIININFKNNSSCFVTLTFADGTIDVKTSRKTFDKFIENLRKIYDNFRYVTTVEFQDRGAIHYHLVCNITDESDATNSVNNYWKHGESNIQSVYDIEKLSVYMTKEFIKQDDTSPLFGKRCYSSSRNLEKGFTVSSWSMNEEDFEAIKNVIVKGNPKKKTFSHHERAGNVEYSTYELFANHNSLFGDYVIATRKKLQF